MSVENSGPRHFTYASPVGDLKQGDILSRSKLAGVGVDRVADLFQNEHRYLVVLTQTCDLVNRPKPKAEYLALAPTLPFAEILENEIAKHQKTDIAKRAGVCSMAAEEKIRDSLSRLVNNNIPEYFYLHEEHGFGVTEPMCTLLRHSKAVVITEEVYSTCLNARVLSLNEEFTAKLGWLVGNIYSRVATRDWEKSESRKFIKNLLNSACTWVDKDKLQVFEKSLKTSSEIPDSADELRKLIDEVEVKSKQEQILDIIRKVSEQIDASQLNSSQFSAELCTALKADTAFSQHTK